MPAGADTVTAMLAAEVLQETIRRWADGDYVTLVAVGEVEFVYSLAPSVDGIEGLWRAELEARARIDGLRLVAMFRFSTPLMQIARRNTWLKEPTSYSDYELSVLPRAQQPQRFRELVEREWASELAAARERLSADRTGE